jgi:WD40 repeat protein
MTALIGFLIGLAEQGGFANAADPQRPTYEQEIKPILVQRCTICHSARNQKDPDLSGGLALDTFEAILAGTKRHKVVLPGRSAESELVRRLSDADEDRRMPLQEDPLPQVQRDLIGRWIDAGTPRGIPSAQKASVRAVTSSSPVRPLRRRPALDVVIPTKIQLAPKTLSTTRGGPLAIVLPVGPLPAVCSLAFRGDNRLLAVGTYGQVVLWDLVDGQPAGVILAIPGPVHALAFSRDGRRLVVGAGLPARSGVVRVYSVPDGTLIDEFSGHKDVVFAVALRPDGTQLASASFDQTVRLWNLAQGRPAGTFQGHSDFVYAVAYTPDGRHLLTSGKDRTIKRIDARSLEEERTYSGHNQDVMALAAHPDGKRFVTAGEEPQIRWWTLDGDKPVSRRGGHGGPVHQLAFSGDGRRLISAAGDRSVRLWDGTTGASLRQLPGPTEWQYAVAITDDARLAAAGGWDGLVRLWDADSGRLLAILVQPPCLADSAGLEPTARQIAWFVACPEGYVAGSCGLIEAAQWRAGDIALPAEPARAASVRRDMIVRALHGEPINNVSFSTHPSG